MDDLAGLYQHLIEDAVPDWRGHDGLNGTPRRAAKAWRELTAGYHEDCPHLTTFEDAHDEIVLVAPIPFASMCEHHLLPIVGVVHVAYIPNGRILGLSKFPRLIRWYARRLQVQERLTTQIADHLCRELSPVAVGVVARAEHFCMSIRGAHVPGALTTTSVMRGAFRDKPEARAEALGLMGL